MVLIKLQHNYWKPLWGMPSTCFQVGVLLSVAKMVLSSRTKEKFNGKRHELSILKTGTVVLRHLQQNELVSNNSAQCLWNLTH